MRDGSPISNTEAQISQISTAIWYIRAAMCFALLLRFGPIDRTSTGSPGHLFILNASMQRTRTAHVNVPLESSVMPSSGRCPPSPIISCPKESHGVDLGRGDVIVGCPLPSSTRLVFSRRNVEVPPPSPILDDFSKHAIQLPPLTAAHISSQYSTCPSSLPKE